MVDMSKLGLTYMTPRYMRVDIWQIAVLNYVLVAITVGIIFQQMWAQGSYSFNERPLGSVNA